MQWLWCWGSFGMLSQKYHYYFLILAVQLLTYYFPVHTHPTNFLLSHGHVTVGKSCDHINLQSYDFCFILSSITITTWASIAVLHMPSLRHFNLSKDLVQVTWVGQSMPSSDFCRSGPHLFVYCAGKPLYSCCQWQWRWGFHSHPVLYFLSSVLWCCKAQMVWQW